MSNILQAIHILAEKKITNLLEHYNSGSGNRITSVGDALERYIQDLFANTLDEMDEEKRLEKIEEVFSYQGNTRNPPDAMLKKGDAIEVKKIEKTSPIALNSSYPKQKLYSDDTRITPACKDCEEWDVRDIIYAIGTTNKTSIQHLWLIYGDCYCANKSTYENIANAISNGIKTIGNIELESTNELARVNKVDPLGITYLRVRGMWGIEHPSKVFNYICSGRDNNDFSLTCIMRKTKFESFSPQEQKLIMSNEQISVEDKKIKNPDNPAQLIEAKLITLDIKK